LAETRAKRRGGRGELPFGLSKGRYNFLECNEDCCDSLDGQKEPSAEATIKFKMDGSGFGVTVEASHPCGVANYTAIVILREAGKRIDSFTIRRDYDCKSPTKKIKETTEWGAPPARPLGVDMVGKIVEVRLSVGSCCWTVKVLKSKAGLF
jgi:hypothetical protein